MSSGVGGPDQVLIRRDQAQRRAAERRRRRVAETPEPLRALVADFEATMMAGQDRARCAGTRPRADHTIEHHLATTRDFAHFLLGQRGKADWARVDVGDVEAFLTTRPAMAESWLTGLRRLMRTAKTRRVILIDPTTSRSVREPRAFHGRVLDHDRQRQLFWEALEACLAHRVALKTSNPHVIVTEGTKLDFAPASHYYMTHVLDSAGLTPKAARNTRSVELAASLDPKILATVFGLDPRAALYYTGDRVDHGRLQHGQK